MQKVIIKGTKDGLLLQLNDQCSFSELINELDEKLMAQQTGDDSHTVYVKVHTGNRLLTESQRDVIAELVRKKGRLEIDSFDADVLSKTEAERILRETEIHLVSRIIRSGQVLKVTGDLLLIGDVNPGGMVMATGNIFVLGALKGTAHAGYGGNKEAVICASDMRPALLKIADCFGLAPERQDRRWEESECAYVGQGNQIIVDRLATLKRIRPNLNRFVEGGNGTWVSQLS